jgi:hypothetical protein
MVNPNHLPDEAGGKQDNKHIEAKPLCFILLTLATGPSIL